MAEQTESTRPTEDRLLEVIKVQTEIAQLGLDLGGVMTLVSQRAQRLTGANGAVVELAEGEDMVYRAVAGITEKQLGLRLKHKHSLSGLCVDQGEPLYCKDSEEDARVDRQACRKVGLRSMIVVPLKHHDFVIGALKVLAPTPDAFTDEDMRVLGLMGDLIAASMFHAGKYETDELFHRATYDSLTGLANRALYYDRLRQRFAQAQRDGERFGLLNLDMDGLKGINDSLGHRAGDAAIKELGNRVKSALRQMDTVARTGGDEFGVLLHQAEDIEAVDQACRRVGSWLSAPFKFEGRPITLSASIGSAVYPDDGDDMDRLLEIADQTMYRAKRQRAERRT